MSRLVLGTAQLGAAYGATNVKGRLSDADVASIMAVAKAGGIKELDTASGYGDAQRRIAHWAADFRITTKVAGTDPGAIPAAVSVALSELGLEHVSACLVHDWPSLDQPTQLACAQALEAEREAGRIAFVGISGYEAQDVANGLRAFRQLDVVQLPANVLDRRLDNSAVIEKFRARGGRVQVRSVFLQGLLATRSTGPLGQHPAVLGYHAECERAGVSPMAFALRHVRGLAWVDKVVVGVTSETELHEVLDAWESTQAGLADAVLASDDVNLIDPRLWAR